MDFNAVEIHLRSPPGATSFFRAVPRARAIYFDGKVVPGIPRVAGDLVKTRKVGANSPRTAARLCHVFGHFEGAGQL